MDGSQDTSRAYNNLRRCVLSSKQEAKAVARTADRTASQQTIYSRPN